MTFDAIRHWSKHLSDRGRLRTLVHYFMTAVTIFTALSWIAPYLYRPPSVSSSKSLDIPILQNKLAQKEGAINVAVLLGTRPEAIKLAPVVLELRSRSSRFNCILVSTGQHDEMLEQVMEAFGLGADAVDFSLKLMTRGQTLPGLTSRVMDSMTQLFNSAPLPDMILVQGDTTTAFIGALASFYFKIPVGHVEAGLRTGEKYSPFPEEVNRQSISVLATMHFASTVEAAKNLLRESKDSASIFVTGNPVVDALRKYADNREVSEVEQNIKHAMTSRCESLSCSLVLLTAHRRENHGRPLVNIMEAMSAILKSHPDVFVVYPVHMNPDVRKSIKESLPSSVFSHLESATRRGRKMTATSQQVEEVNASHFDRFMLMEPLDYPDLIKVMNMSSLIITDSGGIQEEGAVLGKPIIILRDTTERPEGVEAGIAKLVGTDTDRIIEETNYMLLNSGLRDGIIEKARTLYGDGHASEKIADLLEWYFTNRHEPPPMPPLRNPKVDEEYDLVVVLTVWKRDTLHTYLEMLSRQTILQSPGFKTNVVVFQNSAHLNVTGHVEEWSGNDDAHWGKANVSLTYIKSPIPTGYFGRFLVPLLSDVRKDGYFLVCDDDVNFGTAYLENMLRVVDDGYLAVRVGRFVDWDSNAEKYMEGYGVSNRGWHQGMQVTFDQDIEYDFGGQLWAGKIGWLRRVWRHPPPSLVTSEDFWISAVLKSFYGIGTKRPRCPHTDVEQCACSMLTASDHKEVEVGAHKGGESAGRQDAMNAIVKEYNYKPLGATFKTKEADSYTFHEIGHGPLSVRGTFQDCLFFT